jgi:putative ABC transport system ATP-binding protein
MTILELRDVHRVHGGGETAVHALRGVTLTVDEGELVAVMGPSGSGKSTLLNLAGGLDRPTSGEVVVDGTVLGAYSRRSLAALRRRRIGYVFQDLNLISSLMAAENVALPLELDGVRVRQARRQALEALCDVDLDGYGPRFPDELSGGQQQRVAIAAPWSASAAWCWPTSRPARWTRRPARRCCACCAPRWTPERPASWSPTRRGTPLGPTGWCSLATA